MNCSVCGGEDFEKHGGFMYCAVCQTQSRDYHEQEYDYQDHRVNLIRQVKSSVVKSVKPEVYDDGNWTTWEIFNYILYGMTKEIRNVEENEEFEKMVLTLWSAYLHKCEVAFISKHEEKMPKLGFRFKDRDARILYNIYSMKNILKKKRKRRGSCSSNKSNTSISSSISSQSKKSLLKQRGRIMEADYQDHLLMSSLNSSLADETLESLGKSSESETEHNSGDSENLMNRLKFMFTKTDYKLFKKSNQSEKRRMSANAIFKKSIRSIGKNKLLSIIHLALLMTGSQIQLSDLLRFIRESQLSYAKVTHFFPPEMKFSKKDISYVEVISDALMPTHLHQRKIASQLAYFLEIKEISVPNLNELVDRYCLDLNLPNQIAELSKKVSARWFPTVTVPRSKTALPCYEAWAMVSIIFIIKLLFGLNGKTEIVLSCFARDVNCASENSEGCLFVFEDWQKFIECRKTVLTNFHYPTQEQLDGNFYENYKNFVGALMKESKDEYRKQRFIPYSKYYIEEKLLNGVKEALDALSESQNIASFEFQPSLTPQFSHTETIIRYVTQKQGEIKEEITLHKFSKTLPEEILKRSFKNCDIEFVFNPENCFKSVEEMEEILGLTSTFNTDSGDKNDTEFSDSLLDFLSNYWIFDYSTSASGHLSNFKYEVLEKTPENFQWLIIECARMLEMNVRDVYDELLLLEKKYKIVADSQVQEKFSD